MPICNFPFNETRIGFSGENGGKFIFFDSAGDFADPGRA
jgi:hypothetical protein